MDNGSNFNNANGQMPGGNNFNNTNGQMPGGNNYNNMNGQMPGGARVIRLNMFSVMAVIFAMLAVLTVLIGFLPLFFGSMAIIFAVLSKGGDLRMNSLAKSSVIGSILAMIAGAAILVSAYNSLKNDPMVREAADKMMMDSYGVTFDEYWKGIEQYQKTGEVPEFIKQQGGGL